jgi:hypothetical protein
MPAVSRSTRSRGRKAAKPSRVRHAFAFRLRAQPCDMVVVVGEDAFEAKLAAARFFEVLPSALIKVDRF